jgi:dihydroorotate dehydrogenase electron transfer subunit
MDADPALTPGHEHDRRAVSRDCRVVESRRFAAFSLLSLAAAEIAVRAEPGQFVMVGVPGGRFLLRRPLSLHSVDGERVRLLVEARGGGSTALAAAEVGDTLPVAGPLGSGFGLDGVRAALLVAGGVGAAPLQFVADELVAAEVPLVGAFGFRDAAQARLVGAFEIDHLWVASEDGSVGRRGTVVELLDTIDVPDGATVFACGPAAMVAALAPWVAARGLDGFASLEAHMACGTGACHGCVVPTRSGYRRVCADGPVFGLNDLEAAPGERSAGTEEAS